VLDLLLGEDTQGVVLAAPLVGVVVPSDEPLLWDLVLVARGLARLRARHEVPVGLEVREHLLRPLDQLVEPSAVLSLDRRLPCLLVPVQNGEDRLGSIDAEPPVRTMLADGIGVAKERDQDLSLLQLLVGVDEISDRLVVVGMYEGAVVRKLDLRLPAGHRTERQLDGVVPVLVVEQLDLDGFSQFGSECETCMYWWNENITAELPELE